MINCRFVGLIGVLVVGCGERWPEGSESVVEQFGCAGGCLAKELLLYESRELVRSNGEEIRRNEYIFVWANSKQAYWLVANYARVSDLQGTVGRWGDLFTDSTTTLLEFNHKPTLQEALPALEDWTFTNPDFRGKLLESHIYFDAWDRAFGERPELAYVDKE
jgi:hypothetical protein